MKCIICKSEDIINKEVDEEVRSGEDIVLYQIKVMVCNSCGERYYDRKTMQKLETIRAGIKDKKIDIEKVGDVYRTRVA